MTKDNQKLPSETSQGNKIAYTQKRDGRVVPFNLERIEKAIEKAITATGQGDGQKARKLSKEVLNFLQRRFRKGENPTVEQIQDIVEEVLILNGYVETARAYILYREQRRRIRESKTALDEAVDLVDKYVDQADWRIKENSNMGFSIQGLHHYITSNVAKRYWLNKIYPKEIRQVALSGDFHIHDLDFLGAYCCGWELQDLLLRGFGGVFGKVECSPPKHFRSALGQAVNFFFTLQGESAGAQAFSDFDALLAPFIRYDNLDYRQVKQAVQEFIYNCAIPTRVGFQTPFTNITLDLHPPEYLKNQPVIVGGKPQKETYGEFQEEMNMFNRAFCEVMTKGDSKGRVFSVGGDAFCLIKDSGVVKMPKIGEYIDYLIENGQSLILKENQAEVVNVRQKNIKCLGLKDNRFGWQKINFVVRHPAKELLEIKLAGGAKVKVTPSHSVIVLKNGQIQDFKASNLKIGDYLISPKAIPNKGKAKKFLSLVEEFIKKGREEGIYLRDVYRKGKLYYREQKVVHRRAYGRKRYQYLREIEVFPLKSIGKKINQFDLSKVKLSLRGSAVKIRNLLTLDSNLAEFLGWYCAEGSAEQGNRGGGGISFGLNLQKEKAIAERIANLAKSIFGSELPVKIREVKERNLIEVRIHSKLVRRIVAEVFEIKKGRLRQVPEIIFNLSVEQKKAFLRGYFRGDAWLRKNRITVNSISLKLILGISTLLRQLSIFHTLNEYQWRGRKRWRIEIWTGMGLSPKESWTISKIPIKDSGLFAVIERIKDKKSFYLDKKGRRYRNTANRILSKFGVSHQNSVSVGTLRKILRVAKSYGIQTSKELELLKQGNVSVLKIRGIKKEVGREKMVYDFSTESGNFVANHILVHNTFPIPTINITKDFDWDNPNYQPIWEMTAKYGIPYFSNFVNSDMSPDDARSMCCRLRIDNRELHKRGGGLFGSSPLTGSIGVVTINLPRIGYLSKTKKEFFQRLGELMDLAKKSLEIKRKAINNFSEKGLYPYSVHYLEGVKKIRGSYWGNHFSTIGLIGTNEALLNFIGKDIASKEGLKLAVEIMDFMRERLVRYQEETGNFYNLEATPAEGTAYSLAQLDKERYPDIITAGTSDNSYYTNSTQLPVNYTDDLFEALRLQDPLQSRYTGGTVFHAFLGEKVSDWRVVPSLIQKVFSNFTLPYFSLTPTFSICPVHGYLPGEHFTCPKCVVPTKCEVYSRVVGYLRPVQQWNKGKAREFEERKVFNIGDTK